MLTKKYSKGNIKGINNPRQFRFGIANPEQLLNILDLGSGLQIPNSNLIRSFKLFQLCNPKENGCGFVIRPYQYRSKNSRISTYFNFISTLFLFILFPLISNAQTSNLNQYLQTAAENNPEIRAKFNEYMAALEQVPQVKTLPDPEVAFGYFVSPIETRVGPQEMRFSVSQMFPWFGTLNAKGEQATLQAKAKYQEFQATKNEIFWKVKKTWYKLYHLEEQIRITRENIEILKSFKRIAEVKFESGQTSMVDVLRAEMNVEELQNKLKKLEDEREPFQKDFAKLLNKDMESQIPLPDTMDVHSLEQEKIVLLDSLQQNNPKLKQLAEMQKARKKGIKVARKEGYPDFGLGLDYIVTGERDVEGLGNNGKDAWMPRLSVKIPLYRKKYKAKRQEAQYRLEATQNQQQNLQNTLITQFEEAYQNYRDARRRVQLYQEQINRARQTINILTANYSSAGEDFEEILRMQRKMLDYRLSLEKALVDQNVAVARIRYLTGNEIL